MKYLGYALCVLMLACSCNDTDGDKTTADTIDSATTVIVPDTVIFPFDISKEPVEQYRMKILQPRGYHPGEVTEAMATASWLALYKKDKDYVLDKMPVRFERIFDALEDRDTSSKSGWLVKPADMSTLLLISGWDKTVPSKIISIDAVTGRVIKKTDSVGFEFGDKQYSIVSQLAPKSKPDSAMEVRVRIFLKEEGSNTRQLLIAHPAYETGELVRIIFAGDIDGDNLPDLVINASYDDNVVVPVLYLSGQAKAGELVGIAAMQVAYGG